MKNEVRMTKPRNGASWSLGSRCVEATSTCAFSACGCRGLGGGQRGRGASGEGETSRVLHPRCCLRRCWQKMQSPSLPSRPRVAGTQGMGIAFT